MTAPAKEPHPATLAAPLRQIVELRRYRLKPGARERLIDLFEREFVETQEAAGMSLLGQFRDLDRPDDFVWLRGFADMESRAAALSAFYDGPVWAAHGAAANATMVSSDDVLLLRPVGEGLALGAARAAAGAAAERAGAYHVRIFHLTPERSGEFPAFFAHLLAPILAEAGASRGAAFVSETAPNTYPRLPVREDTRVFAWFARFEGPAAREAFELRLAAGRWTRAAADGFGHRVVHEEVLRLEPTERSRAR